MKTFNHVLLTVAILGALISHGVRAEGFTDSDLTFYGEVRQIGGAGTVLLQSGQLQMTFVNQADPGNRVTVETALAPTGVGTAKPYSYAIKVPLAYLPEEPRMGEFLAIGAASTDFRIEGITIDGVPATLPDGSTEFFGLSFASRADQYRLDLLVAGDGTDTDGDGLPDWYEDLYGLDADLANGNADFDGDGWSNLEEFLRGSDPSESNTVPQLATAELVVPQLGEAGCYLQIHDSDTAAADLQIEIDPSALNGFQLRLDGSSLLASTTLSLADLHAGRLTIAHHDPAVSTTSLPLTWNDGGEQVAGSIVLRVAVPSTSDGNDAAMWLDAASLPVGTPLASWSDRSGNDRSAMQPVEANQPTVATVAGLRGVTFGDPTSHLFFDDAALPTGDHTVLAAWRSSGSRTAPEVLFSSNRAFLQLEPTAEAVSYPGAPFYQADGHAVRGYESTLGATSTSIFRREGTILQNVFGLSYNGEEVAAEAIDPVLPTIGARRLALPVPDPITNGFQGALHELLIFPTALPEQKLRDVHDYLQSKWSGFVTWDFSTSLQPVTLAAAGPGRHIIRGGHGDDDLRGGDDHNILSGGPGSDTLRGSPGFDTFVFGGVDTGNDAIVDFGADDVIDLSALFWGESGDARQFLSTRLDTNFSTPVPTLDTVLIVQHPGASTQEIVLRDTVLGPQQVIELIVEGRLRMGGLSIPTEVSLALAAGSEDTTVLGESLAESFTVELTRSGDGVSGELEVPLGLFQEALGSDLVIEGSDQADGRRAVVTMARGETSKQITFRPVPDLETEGTERWETGILPHFRYNVSGGPVARSVSDAPATRLVVVEPNALITGQAARVRVIRDGSTSSPLAVALELDGTAEVGVHINSVPESITIPAGQDFAEIAITTASGWDGAITRIAMLRLVPADDYLVGHPHEATVYAAATAPDADGAGFDRWLTAASEGDFSSLLELLQSNEAAQVGDYLRAYAFGSAAPVTPPGADLSFRVVGNRPELRAPLSRSAADLRWQVQSADDTQVWSEVSASFAEDFTAEGITLLGPPLRTDEPRKLYRLSFALADGAHLAPGLGRLTSSVHYGLAGSGTWQADPATGRLLSTSGQPGSVRRLLVQVDAPTIIDFDMSIAGADGSDLLTFSIDGIRIAETGGPVVNVERRLQPVAPVTLMWEFHQGAGTAIIEDVAERLSPDTPTGLGYPPAKGPGRSPSNLPPTRTPPTKGP